MLDARPVPPDMSAQAAELYALTCPCTLAANEIATFYTDSCYAFGNAHDFGQLWKMRVFKTSFGKAIQHHTLVNDLLYALDLEKLHY